MSTRCVAPSRSAQCSASIRMSRPSASVLLTSTVLPFMALTTSPGRCALPPGMFSTMGATAMRGVSGARRATVRAAAITAAAPDLSCFISSIRSGGLRLIPPESKQTPLPTIASRRSGCLSQPGSLTAIIRGSCSAPWPTPSSAFMPSAAISGGPSTSTVQPSASSCRATSAMRSGKRSFDARLASVRPNSTPFASNTARSIVSWLGPPSRISSSTERFMASVSRTRP